YTMYSLGGFPAVELSGTTAITGEVYEVDDQTFANLDRLEGYPSFYNRIMIDTEHGEAWMYYIEDCSRFSDVVKNGTW
ncbi:MAG: gamma-glutamylcyclotransferase, partial [candidate division Zixibacteria bacterium]|nr:gamma-glutamylcyclotransferase [candidate division Zixibacteria bacterium]